MFQWESSVCTMMQRSTLIGLLVCVAFAVVAYAEDDDQMADKRAMRNALVRFGRSGMRNALVRFGKRADDNEYSTWDEKRNGAPQPFVRFGRSGRVDHIHDILSTLQRLQLANE
ncbi:unnamed protein product [Anisakis simplex]|uniref:FMRFamide-like neuropeptides 11 (inferred by orthology to a C. elegans protein) n=1 Tax=Anisakis simplex TaxID=6269 RepID=A0A0M3JVS7_ANISI|nr:unnamed protein product [Anisakis simplex]